MAARQSARRNQRSPNNRKNKPAAKGKAEAARTSRGLPIAAAAIGLIGAAIAGLGIALRRRAPTSDGSFGTGEHAPKDLAGGSLSGDNGSVTANGNASGDGRAPEAFRPDPTAPIPPGERDAFRPALAKPTLVEPDRAIEPRADTAGGSTLSPQGGRVTSADQPAGDNFSSDAGNGSDGTDTARAPGVGNL